LPRTFLEQLGISFHNKTIIWRGSGAEAMSQSELNQIICREALRGLSVVHLKGGDPLVLGRAGEEIAALSQFNIPWSIIPGISSCTAAPAGADMLLTDRSASRSFAIFSAVCAGGTLQENYPVLDSLVLLMGVQSLAEVVDHLIQSGWPMDTPAAIIERAGLPFEKQVAAPISQIVEKAQNACVSPPGVILVGKAASVDAMPQRSRILFTGPDTVGYSGLGKLLHWPAFQLSAINQAEERYARIILQLQSDTFDAAMIFLDRAGVFYFFQSIETRGCDARLFNHVQVGALSGPAARALREWRIRPDFVWAREDLQERLAGSHIRQMMLVGSAEETAFCRNRLVLSQVHITSFISHKEVLHPCFGKALPEHDVIYFARSADVEVYWNTYGSMAFQKPIQCADPMVQITLDNLGYPSSLVNPCP
jgi:siroheme synthase